ncbi:hypothetical protein BBD46_14345 [Natrialba sp. SSL1]|nr:hypothetical protein BBD46_14345 [Natrialba sp. SSL1]
MTLNSTDPRAAVSSRITTDATTNVAGGVAVTGESERSVASEDTATIGEHGHQQRQRQRHRHRRRTQFTTGGHVGSTWLHVWSPQAAVTEVNG